MSTDEKFGIATITIISGGTLRSAKAYNRTIVIV
jgi:hypothetical protein